MKLLANSKQVMRSIRDNITEDILLNEIYEIIRLPMYADRIRNDSKAHLHTNAARRRWWAEWRIATVFKVVTRTRSTQCQTFDACMW